MALALRLAVVVLAALELASLVALAATFGLGVMLLVLAGSATLGCLVIRDPGAASLADAQAALARREPPVDAMLGGLAVLVGGLLLITHYTRILRYIQPQFVHVFVGGRIVESGGPELADELDANGYERFTQAVGA